MQDLKSLGLYERDVRKSKPNEGGLELRLKDHSIVAWFRGDTRTSDGDPILSVNYQLVLRKDLSTAQVDAAQDWIDYQLSFHRVREGVSREVAVAA